MQQPDQKPVANDGNNANCGVSMKFNFTMGALGIALAGAIAYFAWQFFG